LIYANKINIFFLNSSNKLTFLTNRQINEDCNKWFWQNW